MSEQINVSSAFDPELRQAQTEFDAFMETRPYQSEDGKFHAPDGERIKKKAVDAYFDQARVDHYDDSQETPYEELSMSELADELAYAELTEDETRIGDISDALIDKMDAFASAQVTERNPDGMDADAQMNLFDRVMKLKDQKKVRYLETNGHEISDRVRNEVLASVKSSPESGVPAEKAAEAEDSKEPSIEEMKAEFNARFREAGQAATEGREDAGQLLEEAQELGGKVFKAQIAERLERAHGASIVRDYEAVGALKSEMISILDRYLKLNKIDSQSEEAKRLRQNLQNALDGGEQDIFAKGAEADQSSEEGGDSVPAGSFEGDDAPPLNPVTVTRIEVAKPNQPSSHWDKIRGILGFDGEKQDKKILRARKFLGGAALAGAVLFGTGFLVGNAMDNDSSAKSTPTAVETTTIVAQEDESRLPESVREELEQHEALESAGVTDEAIRTSIIHNPEAFKQMVENPEQFSAMLKWHDNRVTELMQHDSNLSREDAQKRAEKQFRDFVEDLDDEEVA